MIAELEEILENSTSSLLKVRGGGGGPATVPVQVYRRYMKILNCHVRRTYAVNCSTPCSSQLLD